MSELAERLLEQMLIVRVQAGDQAALEQIIDRYQPRLRLFVRKLLGDVERADDVLQDLWLIVVRKVGALNDAAAFTAWIYRIARDLAFGELRLRRRYEPLDEPAQIPAQAVDEELDATDVNRLYAAIDALAPEHREAILLRFIEDMTYEQIAAVTGANTGTVRSRLFYAKQKLRTTIERMVRDDRKRTGQGVVEMGRERDSAG